MGDVAQRPHAFVGEAVVVALLLLGGEPDAAQRVVVAARAARATRSCASTTSRSALPLPCAIQVPEQARITGSTAVTSPLAGRLTTMPPSAALVDVGLAVRDDDDLVAAQLGAQQRAQALGGSTRPAGPGERRYSSSRSRRRARSSAASGASSGAGSSGRSRPSPRRMRAHAGDPAAPAQLRDDHRDQRDHQAQPGDEQDQVAARVLAAPLDEAQVVQQHQTARQHRLREDRGRGNLRGRHGFVRQNLGCRVVPRVRRSGGRRGGRYGPLHHHVMHAHVHRAASQGQARLRLRSEFCRLGAGQLDRKAARTLQQAIIRAAQADRDEPLALDRAVEQLSQAIQLVRRQGVGHGIRQRTGHQHTARVQVAAEPAQRDLVHQRYGQVGRRDQRRDQRQQKPQLEADRLECHQEAP